MALRNYLMNLVSDCAETNEINAGSMHVTIVSDNSFSSISYGPFDPEEVDAEVETETETETDIDTVVVVDTSTTRPTIAHPSWAEEDDEPPCDRRPGAASLPPPPQADPAGGVISVATNTAGATPEPSPLGKRLRNSPTFLQHKHMSRLFID